MNAQQIQADVPEAPNYSEFPRVLLIEDDEFQRMGIQKILNAHRIKNVCAVPNAETALSTLEATTEGFDVTLCDIRLQDMDGIGFLLKADRSRLGAIVLHSALAPDIQQATARILAQRGINVAACLPKPLQIQSLLQALKHRQAKQKSPMAPGSQLPLGDIPREALVIGLSNKEFLTFFQPQITLKDHTLHGVECLCRWNHPTLGLLTPNVFLPSILKYGLMDELTWRMTEYSLDALRYWPSTIPKPRISVNISASTLHNVDFIRQWKAQVNQSKINPADITLELTETEVAPSDDALLEILTRLRIQGFGVALDDFGVGNTSLSQLRLLPITELKIDRTLVSSAHSSGRTEVVLDAIIYMANELAVCSVAEGVESAADAELLRELGCKVGQGYYFARPMSIEKLNYWVKGISK